MLTGSALAPGDASTWAALTDPSKRPDRPATSLVVPMFTLGWAADHDAPFTTEFVDFVTDAVDLYADTRADSIDGFA